jgi:hypothetical protein
MLILLVIRTLLGRYPEPRRIDDEFRRRHFRPFSVFEKPAAVANQVSCGCDFEML